MKKEKDITVAIVGTRGIPNRYGGFEEFAERLALGLVLLGYKVYVYNPHFHSYVGNKYSGVEIIRKFCPEKQMGAISHILYDYNSLRDALKRRVDIVIELGYQSSAFSMLMLKIDKVLLVTNMDGLEWKREKWGTLVKKYTKWAEGVAIKKSNVIVADNYGIQKYLSEEYDVESLMIPYGADIFKSPNKDQLNKYGLYERRYFILVARMEPENNVDLILSGFVKSKSSYPFVVVGNYANAYGEKMYAKYSENNVIFVGGIYDKEELDNLRFFSALYFHGHSVGGTNPSLLEAMGSSALIAADDNIFNRSVLREDAMYFSSCTDVSFILNSYVEFSKSRGKYIASNLTKITREYNWKLIVSRYDDLIRANVDKAFV